MKTRQLVRVYSAYEEWNLNEVNDFLEDNPLAKVDHILPFKTGADNSRVMVIYSVPLGYKLKERTPSMIEGVQS